jgi:hypothetical protein
MAGPAPHQILDRCRRCKSGTSLSGTRSVGLTFCKARGGSCGIGLYQDGGLKLSFNDMALFDRIIDIQIFKTCLQGLERRFSHLCVITEGFALAMASPTSPHEPSSDLSLLVASDTT